MYPYGVSFIFIHERDVTQADLRPRFAYGEMYLSLAALLNRFEFSLFDTTWERDVAYSRVAFLESRQNLAQELG